MTTLVLCPCPVAQPATATNKKPSIAASPSITHTLSLLRTTGHGTSTILQSPASGKILQKRHRSDTAADVAAAPPRHDHCTCLITPKPALFRAVLPLSTWPHPRCRWLCLGPGAAQHTSSAAHTHTPRPRPGRPPLHPRKLQPRSELRCSSAGLRLTVPAATITTLHRSRAVPTPSRQKALAVPWPRAAAASVRPGFFLVRRRPPLFLARTFFSFNPDGFPSPPFRTGSLLPSSLRVSLFALLRPLDLSDPCSCDARS